MGVAFEVWKHRVPEGVALEPLDRFVGRSGVTIVSSDVSGIDVRIFRVPEREILYEELAIAPGGSGPIFNTLQTDDRWTPDRRGYNFRHTLTVAMLEAEGLVLQAGSVYRVEIVVHTSAWGDLVSIHEYTIEPVYSLPA